jgi:rhomboid family GlyGly-CTERM serine protease
LWLLFARTLSVSSWLVVMVSSLAAIDAGLWWLSPAVEWYAGLSGLLHGAWAAGAVSGAARREPLALLLLVALLLKLAWEQLHGASLLVAGFPVVVDAHLYGAMGALVAWRLLRARQRGPEPL